jgi:preprotein translocase subunit SecD
MPHGEAPLYAEAAPVLDEHDFRSVSFARDQSGVPTLSLCFAPGSRVKFVRVVENNVNRRLVFLIRGKLLFAPVIDSEAVPECATIHGSVSDEDAAALRRAIR